MNIITEETFREYFCIKRKNRAKNYGYHGELFLDNQVWRKGMHLVVVMRKIVGENDDYSSVMKGIEVDINSLQF